MITYIEELSSDLKRMQRFYRREELIDRVIEYVAERYILRSDFLSPTAPKDRVPVEVIKRVVLEYFGLTWTQVTMRSRQAHIIQCRKALIYFLYKRGRLLVIEIADIFDFDHSTIVHAKNRLMLAISVDDKARCDVEAINEQINSFMSEIKQTA